ncbi:solute carrier family 46 member 2-like [Dendrobates tinctorius]|uniref:solute carrier family 46 member 2-like n=1 Tax=Dendrobates tinctorius TaxID=92724 RepID=UPI003CCA1BEB
MQKTILVQSLKDRLKAPTTMANVRTWIEPVVAAAQVASSFYDTALLFAVKNYYNHSIASLNTSDSYMLQKSISNFYIIHNLILGLAPLLSAYILAKIGDRQRRKVTIIVPLFGYLISRSLLLLVILLDWPIEVMFGSAALNGLTGWFTTYWAGVMAWASESSSEQSRSLKFIVIELVYGIAGFIGSLSSGHIFVSVRITNHQGTTLVIGSISLYAFCLLYSIFVLKVPQHENTGIANHGHVSSEEPTESSKLLGGIVKEPPLSTTSGTPSRGFITLLFASAILYNVAVDGCVDVLSLFLLNKPLNFNPEYIGYANAAGYMIFVTSFLAVFVSSRWFKDVSLILIGIASFIGGIFIMAFVRWTFLFFIARAVMMFALIPLPTIRSTLSKHIQGSSYGKLFAVLQLSLAISGVLTSVVFNKIYQVTLETFNGTCFIISGNIAIFSLIPISVSAYKYPVLQAIRRG